MAKFIKLHTSEKAGNDEYIAETYINTWDINVEEITYNKAVEFYYRRERTILVGTSSHDYYSFNINDGDPKNFDDCIKHWKNYNDGQPHFFIDNRSLDWDLRKRYWAKML